MAWFRRITVEQALATVAIALLLQGGFETARLAIDYASLSEIRAAQEPSLAEINKIRAQLESLAGETARLAAAGNTNAQAVVDEMRRQDVTLRPPPSKQ